ncbi:MAG TPA: TolC family protein [Usitatibacter sp.]|jgi:NodT family efflux transporter outer membrane factor (OMF) lipoprotein|nr:TolC family protein [Usitatibacter sp.]
MRRAAIDRLAAALALLAGGCALAPPPSVDQVRGEALPNTAVPARWAAGPADTGEVDDAWLLLFRDPALQELITEAMLYNTDLQAAAARVDAAAASASAAGAALFPQVNLMGHGGGKMGGDASGLQLAGLFASWEIDLWGRVRSGRDAATAQYEAVVLDERYARASIAALVAKSWFLAREAAVQKRIAGEMVDAAKELAGLSRNRLDVGKADELEVAQADASVLNYGDLVLQADIARQNALRAIEILAGRYPSGAIDPGEALPPPGPMIPTGLPSQLLERRPDVRAAERRVAAAFHATQQARAARLPRISLTASGSSVSSELFVLKERDNPVWSVGANLLMPVFDAGALRAQVDARTADEKAAVANYGRVGARAFSEVESALSTSFNLDSRAELLERAVRANERALGFARVRFEIGSGDQRAVQQQLLALSSARTSLTHVLTERLIQRVNLHLALGGGFEPPVSAAAAQ